MDVKTLEELVSNDKSIEEKKLSVIHTIKKSSDHQQEEEQRKAAVEPTEALKIFWDRIPLFSIPGINNSGVLELEASEAIGSAIEKLYREKLLGAPVCEDRLPVNSPLTDKYVGLVDLAGMVLWALEELETAEAQAAVSGLVISQEVSPDSLRDRSQIKDKKSSEVDEAGMGAKYVRSGFFELLQQLDSVKTAKVGTLAKSFRWGPFLPVKQDDSLLHLLLLLSRHKLKAVPVVDAEDRVVKGFITQNAAVGLLLQCSGLSWFDSIADKTLSSLRTQLGLGASEIVRVSQDDTTLHAFRTLWKYRISGVPVVERSTKRLKGHVRGTDVRLMLAKPELFHQRRTMTIETYMAIEADWNQTNVARGDSSQELGASICAATLSLGNVGLPKMLEPVVSMSNETLKQTMQKLVQTRSDRSYFVDDGHCVVGVITLRDIINQFAPPLVEPPTQWSGFFENALQLTGTELSPPPDPSPAWN